MNIQLEAGFLLQGAIGLVKRHPRATAIFVFIDGFLVHSITWLSVSGEWPIYFTLFVTMLAAAANSAVLAVAMAGQLSALLRDPLELFSRVILVLPATLIVSVGTAAGLLVLIVPGLYLMARWTIVQPLILLSGRGVFESLSTSWRLTGASDRSLLGAQVVLLAALALLAFADTSEPTGVYELPSIAGLFQLLASGLVTAIWNGLAVFACIELLRGRDRLAETFA